MKHGTLAKLASVGCLTLGLGIQSGYAFTIISFDGNAARWNSEKTVQVEFDPNFGIGINPSTAIKSSISAWRNAKCNDIEGCQNVSINVPVDVPVAKTITGTPKYDGVNQIKYYKAGWSSLPFAPPSSALAVTISTYKDNGEIVDADMFINGENFEWGIVKTPADSNLHDIQNVVTHEFGHFIGLNHTSENSMESDMDRFNATMFYASLPGETFRRTLDKLDILGAQHLYANDNVQEPSFDQISPNQMQVDYKGSATFEITGDNFLPTTSVVFARNGYDGDIVGRVISVENSKITVSFDMSNMQSGTYDLVVANSYNSFVRTEKAFQISNSTVYGTYNNEGSSAENSSGGGGCSSNGSSSILFFLLPLLFIMPRSSRANA